MLCARDISMKAGMHCAALPSLAVVARADAPSRFSRFAHACVYSAGARNDRSVRVRRRANFGRAAPRVCKKKQGHI